MATIQQNKQVWDGSYNWQEKGNEWSASWGGPEMQWQASLMPRLYPFLPAASILEIAPGYGRWTHFLKDHCRQLQLVELSQECIDACKQRFAGERHIGYHVNDGLSLSMIADDSIDLAFSFDSLVHAEQEVITAYLQQLRRKLRKDGVAFLHHSNVGAYDSYIQSVKGMSPQEFEALGIVRPVDHWRAHSVSATSFAQAARQAGLACINQEMINWLDTPLTIDCISIVTQPGSRFARPNRVFRNPQFMDEAAHAARIARAYGYAESARPSAIENLAI
ncbi:MAG: class I SAM-dependent methyltransferase [Rhodothermales bacterium]|nr:class I SAM-dependent methyltransferase [Rhodothermales bacterium]